MLGGGWEGGLEPWEHWRPWRGAEFHSSPWKVLSKGVRGFDLNFKDHSAVWRMGHRR